MSDFKLVSLLNPQVVLTAGPAISGGTQSQNTGTVIFSNSNGVSFGLNNGTMTASAVGGGGGGAAISAGTQSGNTGTIVFSNSNGITFGMSGSTRITASHDGLTSQSNQALSGSNGSFAFQTASFGNLNGLSFYTSNGSMVGSYTVPSTTGPFAASAVTIVSTGTAASYDNLQEVHDVSRSAGHLNGGDITDAGGGNINVATGQGFIRATNDDTSTLYTFDWPATAGIAIPTDSIRYVRVNYNAGAPNITVSATEDYDYRTSFPLGFVVNEAGTLYINETPHAVGRIAGRISRRNYEVDGRSRANTLGGLIISETGTRNVSVTAGTTWLRGVRDSFPGLDTAVSGSFDRYYRNGSGGWTREAAQTQTPNDNYDDGTGTLAALGVNNFGVRWFYLGPANGIIMVYGRVDWNTLAQAETEAPPPDLPLRLQVGSILLGRIIYRKGASSASTVVSAFTQAFAGTGVADHGNLAGLADDDHPQYHLTSLGVIRQISAGTQAQSTGSIVFSNSNGLSFGLDAGTITGSYTVPAVPPETPFGISAGTQSVSTGTLVFSNSNGITFGMSGSSRVTASHTAPVVSNAIQAVGSATGSGTNTSRFAADDHVHEGVFSMGVSTGGNTLNDTRVGPGRFVLQGGPNITLSQLTAAGALNTIVFSGGAGAAGNTGSISAGTTRATLGEAVFSNSNRVSFGVNGQTITADHAKLFSVSGFTLLDASTGTFHGSHFDLWFGGLVGGGIFTGTAINTFGIFGVGPQVSAGASNDFLSSIVFSNSNGISFGLSGTAPNGGTITASYTVPVSSNGILDVSTATAAGTATSRFAMHDHQHRGIRAIDVNGIASTFFGNMQLSAAGGGVTLNTGGNTTAGTVQISVAAPVAQTNQTGGIYVTAQSTGQSSSSTYDLRTLSFVPDGIISAGWSNGSFRVSATQSNQAFSAGAASSAFQTLSFQDLNSISFSNNAGAVRITHDLMPASSRPAFSAGAASSTFQTLSFQDSNGLSFSNNAGAIRVTYTRPVVSNAIASVGSATNSGTNTSRFAADDHVHAGVFSMGVSNDAGNSAGDTRVDVGRFVLRGGNNMTLSQITAANALNTIVFSGGAGGGGGFTGGMSNIGNTAGTSGTVQSQMLVVGGPNITVSQSINGNSATLSISGNAPGAAAENNWHHLLGANTAGNTTVSGSTLGFSGVNMTLSGTNNSQLVLSVPATSSLSATGAVSIATNGNTISIGAPGPVTYGGLHPYDDLVMVLGQVGQGSLIFDPQPLPNVSFDRIPIFIQNTNSSNSSGSHTLRFTVGLYTRENESRISLFTSFTGSTALTHSGTAGSYSWYSGQRLFPITFAATSIPENRYWIAFVSSTASGGANGTYSNYLVSNLNTNYTGVFGQASNASMQPRLGQGFYSASTTALPGSVGFSQIQGTNSLARRFPVLGFGSSTA